MDEARLKELGSTMQQAIRSSTGNLYTCMRSASLYPSAGSHDDWMYEKAGMLAYTVELRDTGRWGFLLPEGQIVGVGREFWRAFEAAAHDLLKQ